MIKNNVIDRYYYVLLLAYRCRLKNATDSMNDKNCTVENILRGS